jgi:hypothetical protein
VKATNSRDKSQHSDQNLMSHFCFSPPFVLTGHKGLPHSKRRKKKVLVHQSIHLLHLYHVFTHHIQSNGFDSFSIMCLATKSKVIWRGYLCFPKKEKKKRIPHLIDVPNQPWGSLAEGFFQDFILFYVFIVFLIISTAKINK